MPSETLGYDFLSSVLVGTSRGGVMSKPLRVSMNFYFKPRLFEGLLMDSSSIDEVGFSNGT